MRWADGKSRWVRPVHWLLALHGDRRLDIELFGIRSGGASRGHRFRSDGEVRIGHVSTAVGKSQLDGLYQEVQIVGRVMPQGL